MKNKKRLLFLTEATYQNTGYATYSKNMMEAFDKTGKYEIAELSCYGKEDDKRRQTIKWKNYPVIPLDSDKDGLSKYVENPQNQFGAFRFERACLDFKPDVVLSIRDFWMDSFVYSSPFRRIFKWIWMPTIDAAPQNEEWVHYFSNADGIITYSDWGAKIINGQSGGNVKYFGTASPTANCHFHMMDKAKIREEFGIDQNIKIIGTVMRNQRRKLFPVLFEAFKKYLDKTQAKDVYLYCHTSYPDNGWDLAQLLHENGIANRVLFSYVCSNCNSFEVSKFCDSLKFCINCNKFTSQTVNVVNGLNDEVFGKLYNLFDGYIQCANCEGFGIPQIEAAACGVPVACTRYSAMEDVIHKLEAIPIELDGKYKELETGCDRAVPSSESVCEAIEKLTQTNEEKRRRVRSLFEENYSLESSSEVWMNAIDSVGYADWDVAPIIKSEDVLNLPPNIPNSVFVDKCCDAYLIDSWRKYSHDIRMLRRDLNAASYRPSKDGYFYSELSIYGRQNLSSFSKEDTIKLFIGKAKNSNFWEKARTGLINFGEESWLN
jgi:glycosyltransferase involved in cell wall biosynthesis